MKKRDRIRACVKLIDGLLGSDLEPEQRSYVEACRHRIIELSRSKRLCRDEVATCVLDISSQLLRAFHKDQTNYRV